MDRRELRQRIDALVDEPDRMRRSLVALAALTTRLAADGIEPILVGGCRPRDPEQEAILTELDQKCIARSAILATRRLEPVEPREPGGPEQPREGP